jgi:glycosyltransferase involved in cell wall biosynthesis
VKAADTVAALTEGGARGVEAEFGVSCEVLPPPVDMTMFRPCADRDLSHPIVFYPADLADPRKGGMLLLCAWQRVHRKCPEARLVLGGPFGLAGWFMYDFRNTMLARFDLVGDAAARSAIELRGPGGIADLPRWYSEAAVTVLPSVDEAFGMVLTESLACGTPVVASAHGGPSEIVADPAVGATVNLRTYSDLRGGAKAAELADAILYGIELSRRSETADRCRQWARRWDLTQIGGKAERLLAAIARSGGQLAPAEEEMVPAV